MKLHLKLFSLYCVFLFLAYSCESESVKALPIDNGHEYANIKLGRSWEYKYDTINYLSGGAIKQMKSGFLKITIDEQLENGKFRVIKSIKKDSLGQYTPFRAEIIELNEKTLTTTDHNLTFINLVFPPKKEAIWKGNRLFNEDIELTINDEIMKVYNGWDYTITTVDTTLIIHGRSYLNTVEVVAGPKSENLISQRIRKEYYTQGVGLSKVHMEVLNTQKILPNAAWRDKAESGFIYVQELVRFVE